MSEETASHLLPDFLAAFVPIRIAHFERLGGPSDWDFSVARDYWQAMTDRGEGTELFFVERGKTARTAGMLVELVACLAFAPGGIKIMGLHFVGYRGGSDVAQKMRQVPKEQAA